MSAPEQATPAVVLRTQPLRESDLIVVLLTASMGKVDTIARGARRSRRRFPGGLPVGARGEAQVARGHGRYGASMARLDGFAHSVSLLSLGRDLDAFAYTNYVCELCDHLVNGTDPDPQIFAGLCRALAAVAESPTPGVLRAYELGLMATLGLLPSFAACGVCGSALGCESAEGDGSIAAPSIPFDIARGGALCDLHAVAGASVISAGVLSLASDLCAGREGAQAALARASVPDRRGLRDLCQDLLRLHLRRPLRSVAFFAQLSAMKRDEKPQSRLP